MVLWDVARYLLLECSRRGKSAAVQLMQVERCLTNPLLVETSGRYKLLARQKVSFTAAFQSHWHPPEMVSSTHLETIYSHLVVFGGWKGKEGFGDFYSPALNTWVALVACFLWLLLSVLEFPNILVLNITPWPVC